MNTDTNQPMMSNDDYETGTGASDTHPHSNLPRCEGFVHVELSNDPVPFHFVSCFPCQVPVAKSEQMALHLCRLACMSLDVVRGKMPVKNLARRMTDPCIEKLETVAKLLNVQMRTDRKLRNKLYPFPAVPMIVDGMLKSTSLFEASVGLKTGWIWYWASIEMRRNGSRWICDFADLG